MNLSRTLGQLETSAQLQAVFDQDDLEDLPTVRASCVSLPAVSRLTHAPAHPQLFDFFDTERTGSVNGKNVERMLFLVRTQAGTPPRGARAVQLTSRCALCAAAARVHS